jgi:hypothetical protein
MIIRPPEKTENVDVADYYDKDIEQEGQSLSIDDGSLMLQKYDSQYCDFDDEKERANRSRVTDKSFSLISNLESINCGAYIEAFINEGYSDEVLSLYKLLHMISHVAI